MISCPSAPGRAVFGTGPESAPAPFVRAIRTTSVLAQKPAEAGTADRRRPLPSATDRGMAYPREGDSGDFAAVADWCGRLSPAEPDTFRELSDRVIARLDDA